MVITMKNIIVGLIFLSIVMAGKTFAQTLDVTINEKSLKIGASIRAVATINNDKEEKGEWVFEAYLHSTDPRVPLPRKFSQVVQLQPGEKKNIEFSFNTQWLVYSGEYQLISEIFNKQFKPIAKSKHAVNLTGGLQHLDVKPILCKDKACKDLSKMFEQGAAIFIDYKSNVEKPNVTATITLPDKSKVKKDLPTEFITKQAGDYVVSIVATKEGYKTDHDTVMFAVIQSTKDTYENLLKRQKD